MLLNFSAVGPRITRIITGEVTLYRGQINRGSTVVLTTPCDAKFITGEKEDSKDLENFNTIGHQNMYHIYTVVLRNEQNINTGLRCFMIYIWFGLSYG